MNCKNLEEFKDRLRLAIKNQSIKQFDSLVVDCPFPAFCWYDNINKKWCTNCPLSDKNGPKELIGLRNTCLTTEMCNICDNYYGKETNKKTIIARLVFLGIKLLSYLDSKE